ncbi:hypothetical protein SAMN05443572_114263 [Myxococcus fulvus]|uniref:Lipoprotein n=1 Tax=Myxococcus fulvus TaxID=33 RepID=A0A511TB55_MYXFU|nr:hypothetical protein [Myxococcus fulvus]AKF84529.1 hypothetical protein MFUL124B02_00440 [Myxococcus fulvus 124B02]GEN11414.1 hypothetical protein MFU01_64510 [Myxococcus fulvus]SEU39989.1 hypothetical protein SAMN05443572_114263 [Myxococcus fulvus]
MLSLMKRLAGTFALMMAVGCGPMDPVEETVAPEPSPPAEAPTVEAMDLDDFLVCSGPISEAGRECVELCVEFAPVASLLPCLVSCGLDITDVLSCLPELFE